MTKSKYTNLNIRGTIYKTTLTKKYLNRKKWQQPNENEIISFIPGTVTKVCVKSGQKVMAGEELLVFEAMKMENRIVAPHNGTVKSVNIKEGDRFPKGIILFKFE